MDINGYILSYTNPDTDGISSALAIAELYKKKIKDIIYLY